MKKWTHIKHLTAITFAVLYDLPLIKTILKRLSLTFVIVSCKRRIICDCQSDLLQISDLFCPPPQLSEHKFFMTPRRTCYFLHSNVLYKTYNLQLGIIKKKQKTLGGGRNRIDPRYLRDLINISHFFRRILTLSVTLAASEKANSKRLLKRKAHTSE